MSEAYVTDGRAENFKVDLIRLARRRLPVLCVVAVAVLAISVLFTVFSAGVIAWAQGTAFGPSALPAPTGAFGVGRVTVHWTDTSRVEPLAADRRHRELMVDVWYPADPMAGQVAAYLDPSVFEQPQTAARRELLAKSGKVPGTKREREEARNVHQFPAGGR